MCRAIYLYKPMKFDSNIYHIIEFDFWGEAANQHLRFLEAMRDLDALVWRLGKMRAPRVSRLEKAFCHNECAHPSIMEFTIYGVLHGSFDLPLRHWCYASCY